MTPISNIREIDTIELPPTGSGTPVFSKVCSIRALYSASAQRSNDVLSEPVC